MTENACENAILRLLTQFPDAEMRVSDVAAELDGQWPDAVVAQALDALVAARQVTRLRDGDALWFSVAVDKLDEADWPAD